MDSNYSNRILQNADKNQTKFVQNSCWIELYEIIKLDEFCLKNLKVDQTVSLIKHYLKRFFLSSFLECKNATSQWMQLQNEIVKHNTTTLRNAKSVLPPKVFQGRMSVVHILK